MEDEIVPTYTGNAYKADYIEQVMHFTYNQLSKDVRNNKYKIKLMTFFAEDYEVNLMVKGF